MQYICGPNWDQRVVTINQQGKVGIIMSGGIDSWVLYNLLDNPTIFNIARADGFDSAARVRQLTGKPVIEIPEITNEHWRRVGTAIDHIFANYNIDQLYYGINVIPPTEYFPEFNSVGKPGRPWRVDRQDLKAPFLHLYKYHIVELANQLHIPLEDTRSCIINSGGEECGECWQCKEKKWGFQQLSC